jgi:hypothetical protein
VQVDKISLQEIGLADRHPPDETAQGRLKSPLRGAGFVLRGRSGDQKGSKGLSLETSKMALTVVPGKLGNIFEKHSNHVAGGFPRSTVLGVLSRDNDSGIIRSSGSASGLFETACTQI